MKFHSGRNMTFPKIKHHAWGVTVRLTSTRQSTNRQTSFKIFESGYGCVKRLVRVHVRDVTVPKKKLSSL